MNMNKEEFIRRYGEEAYKKKLAQKRDYYKANREEIITQRKAHRDLNLEMMRARRRKYYHLNREGINVYVREYRRAHLKRLRARERAWVKANLEMDRANKKRYYQANREVLLAKGRRWEKDNPEKARAKARRCQSTPKGRAGSRKRSHKRRARENNVEFDLTLPQLERILNSQKNKCAICGIKFTTCNQPTLDHIYPLSKGGPTTSTNIQALCKNCNSSKHAKIQLKYIQTWIYMN